MTDKEKLDFLYKGSTSVVNCIKRELHKSCENAVAIGFYLDEIKRCEYWKATDYYKNYKAHFYKTPSGCDKLSTYTFYDYCSDEFHFSRRTVDRYINIFFAFSHINGSSGMRTKFIDEKYKDYTSSQLAEMLQLSEKQRNKINSSMTVKEIRNLKSSLSGNENYDDSEGSFLNKEDVVSDGSVNPEDVNIVFDKEFEDKVYKQKKYHVCGLLYDKFVSTPAQYSNQFVKLQEYLNKGYLVRIVLYGPERELNNEKANKAVNE